MWIKGREFINYEKKRYTEFNKNDNVKPLKAKNQLG